LNILSINKPTRIALETLGCKLNQAETESLARQFRAAGCQIVPPDHEADIYILNTCTVTHVADRKSRHFLRMARRCNPNARIIALGCYAERAAPELGEIEGLDLVIGNREKANLKQILEKAGYLDVAPGLPVSEISMNESNVTNPGRTRSFIKVQDGCNQFCTYCIVPLVRGTEKSLPAQIAIDEVKKRAAEGFREVVLTGTDLGRYQSANLNLQGLVEMVLDTTTIQRVRLSSLQPREISRELLKLWENRRLCRHFHISLQSGSDSILRRMRRNYTSEEYRMKLDLLRSLIPDVSITTDIIVGFPGETEEEFHQSYEFCDRMQFSRVHVFSFSPRAGTRAAEMPDQVEAKVKKTRSEKMLALAEQSQRKYNQGILEKTVQVLFEQRTHGCWEGLTDNYIRVFVESDYNLMNQILPVKISELQGDGAKGIVQY
jgi:threonylcarbamoyladenosine tRNA methylthiotransferase MtaB